MWLNDGLWPIDCVSGNDSMRQAQVEAERASTGSVSFSLLVRQLAVFQSAPVVVSLVPECLQWMEASWLACSLRAQMVKSPPAMWEILGLIPGPGRSPGGGHGNPLQCSCLENPHGQRSLAGYSPRRCRESSRTARLNLAHGTGARNRFVPSHRACELSPQHKWGCPD